MAFTDDFNRADSATVGNGWTENNASIWEILSNKLRCTASGSFSTNICVAPASADFSDGTVSVDLNITTHDFPQVLARLDTVNTHGYLLYYNGGTAYIARMTSGSLTTLTSGAVTLSIGVNYRFTLTFSGSTIDGVVRNVDTSTDLLTLSTTDSTYTSGSTGVSLNNGGVVDYDNFSSTPAGGGVSVLTIISNLASPQSGGMVA